jgi:hypothetical protein
MNSYSHSLVAINRSDRDEFKLLTDLNWQRILSRRLDKIFGSTFGPIKTPWICSFDVDDYQLVVKPDCLKWKEDKEHMDPSKNPAFPRQLEQE